MGSSLVAEHRLWGMQASVAAERGLSSWGSQALRHRLGSRGFQTLRHRLSSRGSWSLAALRHVGSSRTRDRTMSPALAGGFFSTEPPGKPKFDFFLK